MLNCPSCQKRIPGQDLVTGLCSRCGAKLAGDSTSSQDLGQTLQSDTIDPQSVGPAGLPVPESESASAKTVVEDDPVDATQATISDAEELPATSRPTVAADQTVVDDQFVSSAVSVPTAPESSDAVSAMTFVSEDFGEASVSDTAQIEEGTSPDKTLVVDDPDDTANMRTFVGETDAPPPGDENPDRTLVLDTPEDALKTIQAVWGDDEGQPNDPQMTLKAREPRRAFRETQPTLVIKTRSLVDSKDFVQADNPEYELINVLGEGGMGVVYDARQTSIDRNVALKMIKGDAASNEKQKAKFLAEVVVTGDLDHPNIVPVYDVGANKQGNLFYSMKKVQGTPWHKAISTKSLAENLDILMRTADAIGFAHARGIVHRDLKPENIMLGEFGEVLVMDWGLAHPIVGFRKSRSITISASMGGTPAYMAPEMATGPIEKICPASDIYLLGAILYEILTGKPPHAQKELMKCLMAAARNEIAPTEKTGELVDIALKAMATEPQDRYQDVKSFQAAIRDYQSHTESVTLSTHAEDDLQEATRTDDYQHYAKALFGFQEAHELWSGNKRAAVGISQAKMAYAASAERKGDFDLGLSLLEEGNPQHAPLRQQLIDSRNERTARQKRLVFLKRAAMGLVASVLVIVSVAAVWIRAEQKEAVAQAERATKEADRATKAEGLAVAEAKRATTAEKIALSEKSKAVAAAEEEKKAKVAAIAAEKEAVEQREAADAQRKIAVAERKKAEEARVLEEQAKIAAVESQKQTEKARLAAVEAQKLEAKARMAAVESAKKEELAKLAAVEAAMQEAKAKETAITAEKEAIAAQKVAVAEREKAIEAKQKEEYESYISKIGLAASQIDKNAFDAAREVLQSCKPELRNWEWGRLMHLCSQSQRAFEAAAPLEALAVDIDGQRFATGGWNGTAQVWELTTGQVLTTLKHGGEYVNAVAFAPDGKYLATGGNDPAGFIQIWEIATGQRVRFIPGHDDEVLSLAYSKDGTHLLSSSYDKTARLWDVSTGQEIRKFAGHTWWVWSAAFSPDESQIVTAGHDGTAIVWEVDTDKRTPAFTGHKGPVFSAAFSPSGKQVVSAGFDRRVLTWSPVSLKPIEFKKLVEGTAPPAIQFREFAGHTDAVQTVGFSPDGQLLVSAGQDNTIRVWDFASGQMLKTFRGHGARIQAALFLADGKRILSVSHDRSIREWSIDGNQEIRTIQGQVLNGHSDAVLAASYSLDQKQIVTASRDRTARTWNAMTGQPGVTLAEGHSYLASTAIFFPGGKRLLTAAVDNTARIWDVGTGGQVLRLDHTGRSAAAAISLDGTHIVTGADDRSVQLWDAVTGKLIRKLAGHSSEVTAVSFSPDDQWVASGDTKGHVKLWSLETGEVRAKLDAHSRRISALVFSADGKRLFSASGDNTVGQWDVSTGLELPGIMKHPDGVLAMRLVPGTDSVVTSCADHTVRVWNTMDSKVTQMIGPFAGDIYSLSVSEDGQRLLSANSDQRIVRLWDLSTGKEISSPQSEGQLGPLVDLKRQGGLLWAAAFVPGSDDVLTVGGSDARLWDVKSGLEKMSFSPHGAVASARFSPDSKRIVTGSWDNSAKVWDAQTGRVIRKLEGGHTSFINTAAFSPDGQFILTASDDGTAKVWSVETGQVVRSLDGHTDRVRSAAYSRNGEFVVTTSSDATARLWAAKTGELVREFRGHEFAVLCAEFSQDGQWLITGGEDKTTRIWSVATGQLFRTLTGHTASVTSVAFSPDATRIITGSQDQAAKLWDSQTGQEILTLSRHTEDVTSVTFSPDGRQVLTGSRDGTAVIWLSQDWKEVSAK